MRVREAVVRCSLYNTVRTSPVSARTLDAFSIFWLSLSLSGSLRACFFYIHLVDEEQNLSFPFFVLAELALVREIEKLCW